MKLLEGYIFEVLRMTDVSGISSLVEYLNENRKELKSLVWNNDPWEILDVEEKTLNLDNFVYKGNSNLKVLGQGLHRKVYVENNEEWVLKVSTSQSGMSANRGEIEISRGDHGLGIRDIYVKVYDWDRVDEDYPCWIICQKVVPLYDVKDFEILKKVFPSFWNILNLNDEARKSEKRFHQMILSLFSWFSKELVSSSGDVDFKRAFYDAAIKLGYSCVDFEDVVFYDDFRRMSRAFAYVRPNDLGHNFGLISLKNPSPESIVIFDVGPDNPV